MTYLDLSLRIPAKIQRIPFIDSPSSGFSSGKNNHNLKQVPDYWMARNWRLKSTQFRTTHLQERGSLKESALQNDVSHVDAIGRLQGPWNELRA